VNAKSLDGDGQTEILVRVAERRPKQYRSCYPQVTNEHVR